MLYFYFFVILIKLKTVNLVLFNLGLLNYLIIIDVIVGVDFWNLIMLIISEVILFGYNTDVLFLFLLSNRSDFNSILVEKWGAEL